MIAVLDQLLRPLARLAIGKGVRFADVAERLRRAYLHVAVLEAGPKASVSKLSVLTGLQRRDVTRLLADPEDGLEEARPDPLSRLVALWLAQHEGRTLVQHGDAPSFDALARSVRQDVHPRSLLDALISAGTVRADEGKVELLKSAHVPLEGTEAQIRYLGDNVGDHLAVAVGNVIGDESGFELAVHYDGLSQEAVEQLEQLWRDRMKPVLHEVNARASEYQESDPGSSRFRGGGYFRTEIEE